MERRIDADGHYGGDTDWLQGNVKTVQQAINAATGIMGDAIGADLVGAESGGRPTTQRKHSSG